MLPATAMARKDVSFMSNPSFEIQRLHLRALEVPCAHLAGYPTRGATELLATELHGENEIGIGGEKEAALEVFRGDVPDSAPPRPLQPPALADRPSCGILRSLPKHPPPTGSG